MHSLNFNYQLKPFDKTIQLYGDRSGGQGNFDFAGLAELQTMKVVLLKGNPQSLEQPADWRRFRRMVSLAKRLNKPVLLWNLPFTQNNSIDNPISLELVTAIKDIKIQLLRLPQPIISVYDDSFEGDNEFIGISWGDEIIIVLSDADKVQREKMLQEDNLSMVGKSSDLAKKISELLDVYSTKNVNELVTRRLDRVQEIDYY